MDHHLGTASKFCMHHFPLLPSPALISSLSLFCSLYVIGPLMLPQDVKHMKMLTSLTTLDIQLYKSACLHSLLLFLGSFTKTIVDHCYTDL
jgi:hypothetical protein